MFLPYGQIWLVKVYAFFIFPNDLLTALTFR